MSSNIAERQGQLRRGLRVRADARVPGHRFALEAARGGQLRSQAVRHGRGPGSVHQGQVSAHCTYVDTSTKFEKVQY